MKVNCHIDPNIEEEHLDLFVREMNPQISNLLKSFTSTEPVLWCYDADQIIPIKFSDIFELSPKLVLKFQQKIMPTFIVNGYPTSKAIFQMTLLKHLAALFLIIITLITLSY